MIYLIIIVSAMAAVSALNIAFNPAHEWYVYVLAVIGFTVLAVAVDGVVAFVIRRMPEKYFDYRRRIFKTTEKSMKFYDMIGVKRWKDFVPELGMFTNFRKNKIRNPGDSQYLERYILEACYGIVIHYASVPTSFLLILFDFGMYSGNSNLWLTVAVPVAIVNAILILLPAYILKYNLPKIVRLYELRKKRDSK